MKQKNFVIEVIEGAEKRTFIVRELPLVPNTAPIPRLVTQDPEELASFFSSSELFSSYEKNLSEYGVGKS